MFSTTPLEPFPRIDTIAKLIASDKLIIADNLSYNKRQKPNQVLINNDHSITLEITNRGLLSQLEVLNKDVFDRKLIRSLNDYFQSAPYFHFFFDEIKQLIQTSTNYQSLSENSLKWFCKRFDIKTKINYSSNYTAQFDLIELCSNKDENYYVEEQFISYLESLHITNYKPFSYNIITPKFYHSELRQNLSFFELIFEWGPYFNRLIEIA